MLKKSVSRLLLAVLLLMMGVMAAQAGAGQIQTVTVTVRYLNVRQWPTTSSAVLNVIRAGEVYPVIGQSDGWWQIQVGTLAGYVSARYVRVSGNLPATLTPNPQPNPATPTPCALTTLFFGQSTNGICADPAHTTQAAYQTYQHGFMIWLADSGDIWAFINANSTSRANWLHIPQSSYAGLPDATGPAPAGLVQPINGFGRAWAGYPGFNSDKLKDELGWATTSELAYSATWQFLGQANLINTYLTTGDGHIVDASDGLGGRFWGISK